MAPAAPSFNLIIADSLGPYNVPRREWIAKSDQAWDGVIVSALVVDDDWDRILVVQRAAHDSMPNRWEAPGGAVDEDDVSLLHAAARELWEEAGLAARRASHLVTEGPDSPPGYVIYNRSGTRRFCRFAFAVEVESCDSVRLDPNEHQDFVWATEEEVRSRKVGDRPIEFTNADMQGLLLEAFRLRREGSRS